MGTDPRGGLCFLGMRGYVMGSKGSLRTLVGGVPRWPCRTPQLHVSCRHLSYKGWAATIPAPGLMSSPLPLWGVHAWGCTSAHAQRSEESLVEAIHTCSEIPLPLFPITAGLATFYESSGMSYGLNCLFPHPLHLPLLPSLSGEEKPSFLAPACSLYHVCSSLSV